MFSVVMDPSKSNWLTRVSMGRTVSQLGLEIHKGLFWAEEPYFHPGSLWEWLEFILKQREESFKRKCYFTNCCFGLRWAWMTLSPTATASSISRSIDHWQHNTCWLIFFLHFYSFDPFFLTDPGSIRVFWILNWPQRTKKLNTRVSNNTAQSWIDHSVVEWDWGSFHWLWSWLEAAI